ncbi:phage head-tail adapter protein [Sporosarcina sp. E16_8]|uniref:phage head-tail adapter protein n=1 Tax=Sporosarcina sp. E16_8 TaxID=2789295 RepID=UPI001A932DCE|nr:phage head-tail adapter protein [Sporosarcina sp. E16_8]MBO0586460.1 phage head-tail adapter protein [Sporosarcina sp. E16_8]
MAKNHQVRETYNDGFVTYGYKETKRTETGKRIGETFQAVGRLAYKEISCRDTDYQLASFMSATLDYKLKTLFPPSFHGINRSKLKVVKDGIEFDVIKVDPDREKSCLYFYLQEVGVVE